MGSRLWKRFSWVFKSLGMGAVASAVDMSLANGLVYLGGVPAWLAAMAGTTTGAALNFFGNRFVAFSQDRQPLGWPALKYAGVTATQIVLHGQLVAFLGQRFGLTFALAKVVGDLTVFTFLQLVLLRYVVFPVPRPPVAGSVPTAPTGNGGDPSADTTRPS